jgi:hypothetical protein
MNDMRQMTALDRAQTRGVHEDLDQWPALNKGRPEAPSTATGAAERQRGRER